MSTKEAKFIWIKSLLRRKNYIVSWLAYSFSFVLIIIKLRLADTTLGGRGGGGGVEEEVGSLKLNWDQILLKMIHFRH